LPKHHIIIRISNQGVSFNDSLLIPWEQTNFPDNATFSFNAQFPIYWEAAMQKFDPNKLQLQLKVVDYQPTEISNFDDQQPKTAIKSVVFEPLSWLNLQELLSYYKPNAFQAILAPESEEETQQTIIPEGKKSTDHSDWINTARIISPINFSIAINKLTFKMGHVVFEKKIQSLANPISIRIYNEHIIPEFDYVKSFFAKALGSKKINVKGRVEINDTGEIKSYWQSTALKKIDDSLISGIKRLRMQEAIKKPSIIAVDKSLFTPQEFFDGYEEEKLGNTTTLSDQEILMEILALKGIRNRKQLEYLAGQLQVATQGIKFTLSPQFGFLFYIAGEAMDHFIWELLNTNATYLWSIEKSEMSLAQKYNELEKQINFIKDQGRIAYLRNEPHDLFVFNKITHEKITSALVDAFPKWKARLNEKLI